MSQVYTERYTRATMFPKWLQIVGGRKATAYNDIGGYTLDYNPIYGGVQIERIVSDGGGITTVLGRMTAREFAYFVWGLERSLEEIQRNRQTITA